MITEQRLVCFDTEEANKESIEAFKELYDENGYSVTWANRPANLTNNFVAEVLRFSKIAKEDPQILVSCCGEGSKALMMARRFKNLQLLGMDANSNAISLAMEQTAREGLLGRILYVHADVTLMNGSHPFRFHGVSEEEGVLTHSGKMTRQKMVKKYAAVTKPGGAFLWTTFSRNSIFYDEDMRKSKTGDNKHQYREGGPRLSSHFYTIDEMENLVSRYFERVSVDSIREFPHPERPERNLLEGLFRRKIN